VNACGLDAFTNNATFPSVALRARIMWRGILVFLLLAISTVAGIFILAAMVWAARYAFHPPTDPLGNIHSIAVLPFDNLSGDPSQEYFSDGMTDALISDLAQISSLAVISTTSVMSFKGSGKSLPEIARALNVDAIVVGSVTRDGDQVLVSAKLVNTATDSAVWSRNYDREMSDLSKLQADVAQSIARAIRAKLTSAEQQRLTTSKTINAEATEKFQVGNYLLQKNTDDNLEKAISEFTRAIEIEPEYAAAWAGLSRARLQRGERAGRGVCRAAGRLLPASGRR